MISIPVKASKEYRVIIGSGLHKDLGIYAKELTKAGKAAIISDSNVWPIYGQCIAESLEKSGFTVFSLVFNAGEENKNGSTFLSILNFLAENRLTRSDVVVALGGGVVGDITGFAAASYLRGVPYIQIPTTLLAMVDSSVGGKTAIDLPAGKNLAGAFYQPSLVLCDTDALKTLPADIFRDGCAEVIKYGILYDHLLFDHLSNNGVDFDREPVIARCVELKRDVVMEDEFDTGARQRLNLGHTIGHGVEARSNFTLSHGKAVAIGMDMVAKAGVRFNICDQNTYNMIHKVLCRFGLPVSTSFTAEELFQSALSDKKRAGSTVNLIVPERIGHCIIRPTPIEELLSFIEAGL